MMKIEVFLDEIFIGNTQMIFDWKLVFFTTRYKVIISY